jgi:hypothetical protein
VREKISLFKDIGQPKNLNLKNQFQCLVPEKCGVFFYVESATKNSEAHQDIALLLLVVIGGVG